MCVYLCSTYIFLISIKYLVKIVCKKISYLIDQSQSLCQNAKLWTHVWIYLFFDIIYGQALVEPRKVNPDSVSASV